jgi:lauroyl/myristoyl acyltransferase
MSMLFAETEMKPTRRQVITSYANFMKYLVFRSFLNHYGWNEAHNIIRITGLHNIVGKCDQPLVLVFNHIGPARSILSLASCLPVPLLMISADDRLHPPDNVRVTTLDRRPTAAFLNLKKAIDWLKANGVVLVAIDEWGGSGGPCVSFLGHSLRFRRGIAAMARLSGAAIIPVQAAWTPKGQGITISVQSALEPSAEDSDKTIIQKIVTWLEKQALSDPAQISPQRIALYLRKFSEGNTT